MGLEEATKACLFVAGAMSDLIGAGLVDGAPPTTAKGNGLYDQLKASGYRPVESETRAILRDCFGIGGEELDGIVTLITRIDDIKELKE